MVIQQPVEPTKTEERRTSFIGRIQEQRQLRAALKGLLDHHRHWRNLSGKLGSSFNPDQAPRDESYTRVFLLHGIGGIGKSWLTRRCLILAEEAGTDPAVPTLYDDVSLGAPVLQPADLLERIGSQLRRAGFEAELAPYRQAQIDTQRLIDIVTRYRLEHQDRWQALLGKASTVTAYTDTNTVQTEPDRSAADQISPVQQLNHPSILTTANQLLLELLQKNGQLTPEEADFLRDPSAAQATRLVDCLCQIVRERPVIIALDNLEILVHLEPFIRDRLVLPTVQWPMFWILSGRQNLADERVVEIGEIKQVHKGYRDLLGENPPLVWDMSIFGDADLHEYLEAEAHRRRIALTIDDNLIAAVKTTSSGVPLVVEMVADALFTLDRTEFLQNFTLDDSTLLPAGRLERITTRFLRYCLSREDDLERVQGLALLRKGADQAAIRAVWALPLEQQVSYVLHEMRMRYAFVQAEGLHDAVYGFVRRQLQTLRKRVQVREQLSHRAVIYYRGQWARIHDTPIDPAQRTREPEWQEMTRDLLNALLWTDPTKAIDFFLPRLVEALGFENALADKLLNQIEEFLAEDEATPSRAYTELLPRLRLGLRDFNWYIDEPGPAIAQMVEALLKTPELDSLHLSILNLWRGRWLVGEQQYDEALSAYLTAEQQLPDLATDLQRQLGRAYYQLSGRFLWPERASNTVPSEPGLQAAQRAVALDAENGDAWYNLGLALATLSRTEEAVPAFQQAIDIEPRSVNYNSLGNAYSSLDRYKKAADAYRHSIALDPDFAWPHQGLGLVHCELGEYEQAITHYQQAIRFHEYDLDRAASWDGLGDIYTILGRYDEALEAYQQGIELNPNDGLLYYGLGNVYLALDHHTEAIEAFQKAIEWEPDYGWSYHKLGVIYEQRGEHSAAKALYQQAIERHQAEHSKAVSWTSLGDVYNAQDQLEEAISAYQQAMELDPSYAVAWQSLGVAYSLRGRYNEAVDAYRQSIVLASRNSRSHYLLGNALAALDRANEAIEAYQQAIDLEPDRAWAYHNMAYVKQKLGQFEQAIIDYQLAIERHEDDHGKARSWDNLGNVHTALGNYKEAISAYRWASALDPAYPWPYHNLGHIYAEQGKYDQAIALFQQALEHHQVDPGRALSWHKLGDVYQASERFEDAIAAYQHAIELDPQSALNWYSLGNLYRTLDWDKEGDERQDRAAQIIEAYRRAIELDPEFAWPYHNLALLHGQLGQYEPAITLCQQAIERHENNHDRAVAWTNLGDAYRGLDRLDPASDAYRRAIELDPGYAWSYHGLALIWSRRGEEDSTAHESAISFYHRALERHYDDTDRARTWLNLGDTYRILGRFEDAVDAYRHSVELEPDAKRVSGHKWNKLGDVYLALSRLEEATEAFQRAITSNPALAWPYHNLGIIYERLEQYQTAVNYFQQAAERHENDHDRARASKKLGDAYRALDRTEDENYAVQAIEAYRQAVNLDHEYAQAWHNLGNAYRARERFEEAIEAYQQAIELDPKNVLSWNSLGDVYTTLKRFEEAIEAHQEAIKLDPSYPWSYNNLGLVYKNQQDSRSAIPLFKQAIERHQHDSDRAISWNNLGDTFQVLRRFEDAIDAYRQAIKLDPGNAWPYNNLGFVYAERDEYVAAVTLYEQAIERHQSDEDKAISSANLANAYAALERFEEAVEAYQQAINLNSSFAWPWYNLGKVHHKMKRFEEAIDAFLQAIRLDTTFASPWNSLGKVYQTLAREDEAIEAYQHAIKLEPSSPWPYHNLGLIYESQGEHEQAIIRYRQAIERHQSDQHRSVLWYNLGNIYQAIDRSEVAIMAYQKSIELDPTFALPSDRLGSLFAAQDRHEAAIDAYRRVIELTPDDPGAYHNLGLVYEQLENFEIAAKLYRQAISRHQSDHNKALAWTNLGNTYSKQWQYPEAIEAYQQAIELDPLLALPWSGLGDVYSARRNSEQAIEAYRQAINLDPSRARPYINLGFIYEQLNQYEQAIPLYQEVIEHHQNKKDRAVSWANLGNVYQALERHEEAIQAFRHAIELDSNYTWPYHNLAAIYESRGKHEQALALYQQATQRR